MTPEGTYMTQVLQGLYAHQPMVRLPDLAEYLGLTHRQVTDAVAKLILRGYAERPKIGYYCLTIGGKKAAAEGKKFTSGPNGSYSQKFRAPRSSLRQRAWNAMRIQRQFTIPELVMTAAMENDRDPTNNLQTYCAALTRAEILWAAPLKVQGSRPGSNGFKRYSLVKDTGDIAPVYRRKSQTVFDPNTSSEVLLS